MLPAVYDLALYRGDTMRLQLVFWRNDERDDPEDLTGCAANAQIRNRPDGTPILTIACVITLPNTIDLELSADDARDLPKKGVWDVQLTLPSGAIMTPVGGKMTMKQDVTIIPEAP
jgi:hypothetical protein